MENVIYEFFLSEATPVTTLRSRYPFSICRIKTLDVNMKHTNKIALANYEIQFTRLLTVDVAAEHFKQYLRTQLTEESLLFLLAVTDFKQQTDAKQQAETVLEIYNTYVKLNAEKELNIQNRERNDVLNALNQSEQFNNTEKLVVPDTIFDTLYKMIFRELREDSGARYIKSQGFQTFVNEQEKDFIASIAVDISMRVYADVIIRKEDFNQTAVSHKDIDFLIQILSDSTEWGKHNKYTTYNSRRFKQQE